MATQQSGDIQKADPVARRNVAIVIIAALVVGALLILALQRFGENLSELTEEDPIAASYRLAALLKLLAVGNALLLVSLAIWIWRFARRVSASGRFPPPGQRVVRDVRVLQGAEARRRARLAYIVSLTLAGGGLLVAAVFWRLAAALVRAAA